MKLFDRRQLFSGAMALTPIGVVANNDLSGTGFNDAGKLYVPAQLNQDGDHTEYVLRALENAIFCGKSILFGPGIFNLSKTLDLTVSNQEKNHYCAVSIFGSGAGTIGGSFNNFATIFRPHGNFVGPLIKINGEPNEDDSHRGQVVGAVIDGIAFDGCNKSSALYISCATFLRIRNSSFTRCINSIKLFRNPNSRIKTYLHDILIDSCLFSLNKGDCVEGSGGGSVVLTLNSCHFVENKLNCLKLVGSPLVVSNSCFFGSGGHAILHKFPSGGSISVGPYISCCRFESNGRSTDSNSQLFLNIATQASIRDCFFLGSTSGQSAIAAVKLHGNKNVTLIVDGCVLFGKKRNNFLNKSDSSWVKEVNNFYYEVE